MKNDHGLKVISPDVLEKLRAVQLEILDEIVRICEKHGLHYFLMYGTLIGAIRHKGFIPWDDDLDICMPRDDYNRFMEIAAKELHEDFFLQNNETEPNYWQNFAKIRKNHTYFEESAVKNLDQNAHKGIFVDIFPWDYVNKKQGFSLHLRFILAKAINEALYYKAGVYDDPANLQFKWITRFFSLFPTSTLCRIEEKVAALESGKKGDYLADFHSTQNYLDSIFPKEHLFPGIYGEFAGKKYKIPSDYHTCLTKAYGDYMQLPKEEDRVNHCVARIIFDTKGLK